MAIEEIKKLIEENKDNEEVQTFIKGLSGETEVTTERVGEFLETEEGKRLLQPKLDQYFTKGLETWKEKSLPKVVEEEVRKRYPEESEESKKLREMESKLESIESARNRETLKNHAITVATEKGVPLGIIESLIAEDPETTVKNIETVEKALNSAVEKAIKEKFRESGRDVEESTGEPTSDIDKMSMGEYIAYREKQGLK